MLERIIVVSVMVSAVWLMMQDGFILVFLRRAIESATQPLGDIPFRDWLLKPLCGCIACMSSVWGLILQCVMDWCALLPSNPHTPALMEIGLTCFGCVPVTAIIYNHLKKFLD
jgi:hypothetical protein